jgi:hypothetical protein
MKALSKLALIAFGLMSGCGQSEFSLSQSRGPETAPQVLQNQERGVEQNAQTPNQSNADASPVERQPTKVSPPIPVIGSYLVGELLDEARMPVKDAEVTLHETGIEPQSIKTDANGRYRVGVVSLLNVTSISVTSVSVKATLALGASARAALGQALEPESGTAQRLFQLQLRASATGTTQLAYQLVVPPEQDKTIPKMSLQIREVGGGIQVAITATDEQSGLAPLPFSYDRGVSWTSESTKTLPAGTVIDPGMIVVRDRANNRASNAVTIAAQ